MNSALDRIRKNLNERKISERYPAEKKTKKDIKEMWREKTEEHPQRYQFKDERIGNERSTDSKTPPERL